MQVLWIIIGIIVVLAIIAALIYWGRRQKVVRDRHQHEADRERAAGLRRGAKDTQLDARESEVKAGQTQLFAEQATVDAERLRVEAERQQHDAQTRGAESVEQMRQADALDPDTGQSARDGVPEEQASAQDANTPDGFRLNENLAKRREGDEEPN